jgi:hypothetical protein
MDFLGKKGQQWGIVLGVLAIVVVAFVIYAFSSSSFLPADITPSLESIFTSEGGDVLGPTLSVNPVLNSAVTFIFQYVFGMHKGILHSMQVPEDKLANLSIRGAMIIIATWVIFFLVFVDMSILVMGFGSKVNGFLIGLAVSIIFANFALYYYIIIWLMGIFAFLAGLSVVAALFSIIILGVGAHFGAGWVLTALRQKQEIWAIHKGGEKAAAGIEVYKKGAEAAAKE